MYGWQCGAWRTVCATGKLQLPVACAGKETAEPWVAMGDIAHAVEVSSPQGAIRRVGRLLYHGMYLPGYRQHNPAFTGLPDGSKVNCTHNLFHHLIFDGSFGYQWISFYAGDIIPPNAVVSGYWPDNSALYVVYVTVGNNNKRIPAYYNADPERVYSTFDVQSHMMHMLVVII